MKTAYTDNITWAIKENGELWGLGSNECGKLGDGTEENRNEPQKIMDNVRYVKDGGWYTLAITENDELWGWGDNEYGQLGDGTVEESLYPKKIMDDVREVLPHNLGVLAIKNNGELWGWGYWPLGDGNPSGSDTITKIRDDIVYIDGGMVTIALDKNNNLLIWGSGRLVPEKIKLDEKAHIPLRLIQ